MDEDKYKETYRTVNPLQCPFEKTLNSRRCVCSKMERFYLADREGVACAAKQPWKNCSKFLEVLRKNAKFSLKLTHVDGPLPHGKEIKVQNGSIIGLQKLFYPNADVNSAKPDIYLLIQRAFDEYVEIENLPLNELMQSIVHFTARIPHKDKKK
jgi:hypothetical protein